MKNITTDNIFGDIGFDNQEVAYMKVRFVFLKIALMVEEQRGMIHLNRGGMALKV